MYDLLVCIRCHTKPALILDAYDAATWSCDDKITRVVFAVDGVVPIRDQLSKVVGKDNVYCSGRKWGWGVGLYTLLLDSIVHFSNIHQFSHFLSIDYDTAFIRKKADIQILSYISDPSVGLYGHRQINNEHWRVKFKRERKAIEEHIGSIPSTYTPGEGVQGGCMLVTRILIDAMKSRGFFSDARKDPSGFTSIADDHWLPLVTRVCGLSIGDMSGSICCRWRSTEDPRGMEGKGIYVYHPTKIRPGQDGERADIDVRNYFRRLRGQAPLEFH